MPNSLPVLIVGGFGVSWHSYQPFRKVLANVSNRSVSVARFETLDWLSVIVSDDYGNLLKRLHVAVTETLRRTRAERLVLVAHSAGGVLSRIYMGDQPYGRERLIFNGFQQIATLVTIGTPHTSSKRGRFGGLNQIAFVEENYPGSYWRFIRYVSVISKNVRGVKEGLPHERSAWESYTMLTHEGDQWGDGIVPISCGLLEGAHHVLLEGISHDPRPDEWPWYGHDEETVCSWWTHVERIERESIRGKRNVASSVSLVSPTQ
jgi:pimeloyl-ACP methyl ester carboxylesterase